MRSGCTTQFCGIVRRSLVSIVAEIFLPLDCSFSCSSFSFSSSPSSNGFRMTSLQGSSSHSLARQIRVRLNVLVVNSRLGSSCWTVFEFCFRSRKMTKMEMLRQIFPDEHQKLEPNLFHGHLGLVVAVAPALLLLVVGHFLALRAEGTPPPLFGSESLARLTAAGASCLLRGCGGGTWCRIGRGKRREDECGLQRPSQGLPFLLRRAGLLAGGCTHPY